ncbi:hypothetical protein [Pseudonocardia asaccharolytica]|uniref:Uncharacterized protein n=1 Tax=Pseudonocardia asaccharolytica DSM 44247 = NBRC 16224 TaxID=1123024 RepID=A0A511D3K4_9PSEU|nr:hypothetical protein [Pseudonocardia asaccharolytica]GEL19369.1 hypothetical protein PA7_32060 [Pseudonocardia asaccharolytica DSM 44247 = NBRC 16224]
MARIARTTKDVEPQTERRLRELDRQARHPADRVARGAAAAAAQGVVGYRTRAGGNIHPFAGGTRRMVLSASAPVVADRIYLVSARVGVWTDGADSGADLFLTYTTSGVEPTTSSPDLKQSWVIFPGGGFVNEGVLDKLYAPTTDHVLSVLLSAQGFSAGQNYGVWSSGASRPELWITDLGMDLGPSGVDY